MAHRLNHARIGGFTYSEIAAVTHTPESTVKYRAVQARRALRRKWKNRKTS
ncbi:MAG: sigma factor-like helix-turn-helix DNA-binding protein [Christensenellales bacterium]